MISAQQEIQGLKPDEIIDLIDGKNEAIQTALNFAKHVQRCLDRNGEYAPLIDLDVQTVSSACKLNLGQSTTPVERIALFHEVNNNLTHSRKLAGIEQ